MKTRTLFVLLAVASMLCGISQSANAIQLYQNFTADPNWIGVGNHAASNHANPQDFDWSNTNNAGGDLGEAGGFIVRGAGLVTYADNVGTLDASTDLLTASGKGVLDGNGNVLVGWFNSAGNLAWGNNGKSFLGFRSDDSDLYLFADGHRDQIASGLSEPFTFEVTWDPDANGGNGTLSASINGGAEVSHNLGGGDKETLENFNRFGFTNLWIAGSDAAGTMYFDDLTYTSGIPEPSTFLLLASGCLALVAGRRR